MSATNPVVAAGPRSSLWADEERNPGDADARQRCAHAIAGEARWDHPKCGDARACQGTADNAPGDNRDRCPENCAPGKRRGIPIVPGEGDRSLRSTRQEADRQAADVTGAGDLTTTTRIRRTVQHGTTPCRRKQTRPRQGLAGDLLRSTGQSKARVEIDLQQSRAHEVDPRRCIRGPTGADTDERKGHQHRDRRAKNSSPHEPPLTESHYGLPVSGKSTRTHLPSKWAPGHLQGRRMGGSSPALFPACRYRARSATFPGQLEGEGAGRLPPRRTSHGRGRRWTRMRFD